jgi:predicted MFS family arabinose efflux permease
MRTKLTRIALTSLMLVLPAPLCGALATASEIDQRVLEARQKLPAFSFVVMEAKLFEGDSTTEMSCSTIRMVIKSPLATASVAINNTALYLGQAIGFAIGGALFAGEALHAMGFVGLAPVALSFGILWLIRAAPEAR